MSRRKTSSNVASKASKVLTSPRSSGVQRVLAGSALSQAGKGVSVMDGCIPDPDDPATAGCLFALLGPGAMVRHDQHRGSHPDDYTAVTATGPRGDSSSAGRACIAAAEALGRWPGGVG